MISQNHFLSVYYIGIELLSLSLYVMVMNRDSDGGDRAAMKYFVLGALASRPAFKGISMILRCDRLAANFSV